jgi:hypothetical protein
MATIENTDSENQGGKCVERSIHESLLRSEIGFWLDMIETARETEPADSVERMRYALALAETRLGKLSEIYPGTGPGEAHRPSNVYPIHRTRRSSK